MTKNAIKYGIAHIKADRVFWFLLATIFVATVATPWAWAVGGVAVAYDLWLGYGWALIYTKVKQQKERQLNDALAALLSQGEQANEE